MGSALIASVVAQAPAPSAPEDIYLFVSLGLLGLGIVLMVLELFIPTGGVLAVMVGVAVVASIASMFAYDPTWGGVYLAILCAGSPLVLVLIFKIWSKTPIARRMVLKSDADGIAHAIDDGDPTGSDPSRGGIGASAKSTAVQLRALIGCDGTSVTTLRPVGFVKIGQTRIEAIAESGFIAEGHGIVVIDAFEGQLKVRELPTPKSDHA